MRFTLHTCKRNAIKNRQNAHETTSSHKRKRKKKTHYKHILNETQISKWIHLARAWYTISHFFFLISKWFILTFSLYLKLLYQFFVLKTANPPFISRHTNNSRNNMTTINAQKYELLCMMSLWYYEMIRKLLCFVCVCAMVEMRVREQFLIAVNFEAIYKWIHLNVSVSLIFLFFLIYIVIKIKWLKKKKEEEEEHENYGENYGLYLF